MKNIILLFFYLLLFSCNSESSIVENNNISNTSYSVEIYLLNSLNDSRGYCLDILGYKDDANVSKGLQTHSCYSYQGEISVDQGFDFSRISQKEFYIPHFKVCMEAKRIQESSTIDLKECDKNQNQKFILQTNGEINPESNLKLCLTASKIFKEGGGGSPVHLIRDLSLEICDENLSSYQKWGTRKSN
jgi:hypothetical protein|tara:strand:+ start:1357 stop:1920 length:564 start_codon:yes stop_codon:yes gene_type:complete